MILPPQEGHLLYPFSEDLLAQWSLECIPLLIKIIDLDREIVKTPNYVILCENTQQGQIIGLLV